MGVKPRRRSGDDKSEFIYEAEIGTFTGGDASPAEDRMDEVVVGICNPSGMDPVVVNDVATCGHNAEGEPDRSTGQIMLRARQTVTPLLPDRAHILDSLRRSPTEANHAL